MKPSEAVIYVIEKLESLSANYLLVGAFAYGAYGIPRSTEDADLVLAIGAVELDEILRDLPSVLSLDPQSRMELFTGTHRWVLRVDGTPFLIELFLLGSDPHHHEMFLRKRRGAIPLLGREAWIPTAEDLVIQKLRWGRPKDLDDVRNVLSVQGEKIDKARIELWCTRHATLQRYLTTLATVPLAQPHPR